MRSGQRRYYVGITSVLRRWLTNGGQVLASVTKSSTPAAVQFGRYLMGSQSHADFRATRRRALTVSIALQTVSSFSEERFKNVLKGRRQGFNVRTDFLCNCHARGATIAGLSDHACLGVTSGRLL